MSMFFVVVIIELRIAIVVTAAALAIITASLHVPQPNINLVQGLFRKSICKIRVGVMSEVKWSHD